MARTRSPDRDKAFEIWKESNGKKKLKDIATELSLSDTQIRKWKNQDKWDEKLKVTLPNTNSNVTKKKGPPYGSKNALGNKGGAAPKGNQNAVKHGLFAKYLPQETMDIVEQIGNMSPIEMLWMNIKMHFAQIMRAQQIMFVTSKEEMIKELKKEKYEVIERNGEAETVPTELQYEFQFAWDRHATFLNSQSRAMAELRNMLKQFSEMSPENDTRKLEVARMEAAITKTKKETEFTEERTKLLKGVKKDTGLLEALIKTVTEDE